MEQVLSVERLSVENVHVPEKIKQVIQVAFIHHISTTLGYDSGRDAHAGHVRFVQRVILYFSRDALTPRSFFVELVNVLAQINSVPSTKISIAGTVSGMHFLAIDNHQIVVSFLHRVVVMRVPFQLVLYRGGMGGVVVVILRTEITLRNSTVLCWWVLGK